MILIKVEKDENNSGRKTKNILKNKSVPIIYSECCRFVDEIQKLFFEDFTKKNVLISRI